MKENKPKQRQTGMSNRVSKIHMDKLKELTFPTQPHDISPLATQAIIPLISMTETKGKHGDIKAIASHIEAPYKSKYIRAEAPNVVYDKQLPIDYVNEYHSLQQSTSLNSAYDKLESAEHNNSFAKFTDEELKALTNITNTTK